MIKILARKLAKTGLLAASLCGVMLASPLTGHDGGSLTGFVSPAMALDPADKPEIEKIIHDYLLANPEILIEMQSAFEKKQQAAQSSKQQETLSAMKDKIFASKYLKVLGNPDGKIQVVEFFDYNCGFCQHAMADTIKIIEKYKDVKFMVREFPVLGPDSQEAHHVAMAFAMIMPDKYPEFHRKLLEKKGRKDADVATALAVDMGANKAKLQKAMDDPQIEEAFQEAYQLADGLGITGTPSYIIGDQVIFGAVGFDKLEAAIDKQRKEQN